MSMCYVLKHQILTAVRGFGLWKTTQGKPQVGMVKVQSEPYKLH